VGDCRSGTGKTHTLVWLTLKRLLVDGVPPQRLMLTTFTRITDCP